LQIGPLGWPLYFSPRLLCRFGLAAAISIRRRMASEREGLSFAASLAFVAGN
jgi:hypothetical protein